MIIETLRTVAPHRFVHNIDAEQFGWYNWKTSELLTDFPIGEGDTVADIGCGDGVSSVFAAQCGATVYAVDIDPNAIASVNRRMKRYKLEQPFHALVSDSNPLPLDNGVATRVLAQEVMEHVDDPRQFIRELVRIGRPGARYLLTVPDPASESLQKKLAPDFYWRKPHHLRVFGRDEFDQLVRDAGLEIVRRAHYSFFWSMWWVLFWSEEAGFKIGSPGTPVLAHWHKTWAALLKSPNGARIKETLDNFMPKSQILIARKAA
ncbi:MAG TPA: class I SAM-dependent methyltransferase [Gemmataceae bacterium]|jgi:SAM-dependent methyltransferase